MELSLHRNHRAIVITPKTLVRPAMFTAALTLMATATSLMRLSQFGNDPYSCMNLGFSLVSGLSFGTCVTLFNVIAFIGMYFFGRHYISVGTWIYLFGLGAMADASYSLLAPFFTVGADDMVARVLLLVVGISVSTFGTAFYMSAKFGMGPYDAISWIVDERTHQRLPFRYARVLLDVTAVTIGFLLGSLVGIGTLLMASATGPMVAFYMRHCSEPLLKYLLNK